MSRTIHWGRPTPPDQTATPEPLLIDAPTAARTLGVGLTTLRAMTATGEIPSVLLRRRRLYRPADLAAFVDRLASEGGAA